MKMKKMFEKKHYVKIGNVIRQVTISKYDDDIILRSELIDKIIAMFKEDNNAFNEKKFREYIEG